MLLIYIPRVTPRATYIFSLVFQDLIGCDYRLTSSTSEYSAWEGPVLAYSPKPPDGRLFLESAGLLDEKNVVARDPGLFEYRGYSAFFRVTDPASVLPFDLFSAAFYLVSRYEEYLPYVPDRHGRFRLQDSLACKGNFLRVPVVNLWIQWLEQILKDRYPDLSTWPRRFSFMPTIDIDHAYAFRQRRPLRTLAGYGRALVRGHWSQLVRRTQVLLDLRKDPYDTYAYLNEVHELFGLSPIFFILFADYGGHDNNVSIRSRVFQELLLDLDEKGTLGIHPSLASNRRADLLEEEVFGISNLVGRDITLSRQHFLWLSFPATYRNLIRMGITDDYSMGYSSDPGFRAGISDPFRFFDLERNEETGLMIHPVSVMDVALRDYHRLTPKEAFAKCRELIRTIRAVNGTFIPVWHNESLSEYGRWKGWRWVYTEMLRYATGQSEEE